MKVFMFRISAIGIGLLFFNQGLLAKCTMLSFDKQNSVYEVCNTNHKIQFGCQNIPGVIGTTDDSMCNGIALGQCKTWDGQAWSEAYKFLPSSISYWFYFITDVLKSQCNQINQLDRVYYAINNRWTFNKYAKYFKNLYIEEIKYDKDHSKKAR